MAVSEGLEPQYLIYTWETTTIIHTIVALWPLKLGFYFDFMSRKKKLRGQFCHHIAGTKSFWFSVISVRDNVQVSYTVSCVMVSKLAAQSPFSPNMTFWEWHVHVTWIKYCFEYQKSLEWSLASLSDDECWFPYPFFCCDGESFLLFLRCFSCEAAATVRSAGCKRKLEKSLQHLVFRGGLPSKY